MRWCTMRLLLLPLLLSTGLQATYLSPPISRITRDSSIDTLPPSELHTDPYSTSQEDDTSLPNSDYNNNNDYNEPSTATSKPHDHPPHQIPILERPAEPPDPWSGASRFAEFIDTATRNTQAKTLAARGGGESSSAVPLIGMAVGLGCTTIAAVVFG